VPNIYDHFGVIPGINARGNQTLLGGSTPPDEVQKAMAEATNSGYVVFEDLLRKTGEIIANILGTEQAFVTSGAAAAIALSSAAALTKDDRTKLGRIPDTSSFDKNEFVFQKGHDYSYKRCFTIPGAKLVEVGGADSCTISEMERAIGPKTAGIAYFESGMWGSEWVSLDEAKKLADDYNIPLIVDSAGQIFPLDRFTRIAQTGDIVSFGAKYFGSPHSTGICTGKKIWVEAAFQQNFIGFETAGQTGLERPFGRGFKTDRGEVVGATIALERWFSINHEERLEMEEQKRTLIRERLSNIDGVNISIPREPLIGPNIVVNVEIDKSKNGKSVYEVIAELENGNPPIWARTNDNGKSIGLGVQVLSDEEVNIVADRLQEILK